MEPDAREDPQQANFTGIRHVRAAARADIRARDGHDAHLPGQLLFAAVGDGFQRFRVRIRDLDRDVFPDPLVGLGLDALHLLRRQHAGKVDRHEVRAHVEAHVLIAEAAVDDAGEDMLAGMQLHELEPAVIVDRTLDRLPLRQRCFAIVDDLAARLMRIRHADAGKDAGVARLAAALGIKAGPVQHDVVAVLPRPAGQDRRLKLRLMRVLIIELFCCHLQLLLWRPFFRV